MAEGEHAASVEMVDDIPFNDSLGSLQSDDDRVHPNVDERSSQYRDRVKVYPEWAKGPFVVYFRQIDRPLNVLNISDILHRTYTSVKEVSSINIKKLRAVFANRVDANDVVTNTSLTKLYRVYVPCEEVEIAGVIYDTLLDPKCVEERGVGHFKNKNVPFVAVLECIRLVSKSIADGKPQFVPSDALRVTFAGSALPKFVNVDNVLFRVRLFTPKLMHCELCQAFNHTAKFCTRKVKCAKCNGNHKTDACSVAEEKCLKCQEKHDSLRDCSAYQEQRRSFRNKIVNRSHSSYAEMVKATTPAIDLSNKYEVLNNYSEELGDHGDEEAHCSYTVPAKRKKASRSPKQTEHPAAASSPTQSNKTSKTSIPPTDWPTLPKSQDIPGFRKVSDEPLQSASEDDLQRNLRQLLKVICGFLSVEPHWVELLDKLIPLVSPFVEKMCKKLPLIGALLNFNG